MERQMPSGPIRRNQAAGTYASAIIRSPASIKTLRSDDAPASITVMFGAALRATVRLPVTWWQRIHFRAQLRADIVDAADFFHDIGISLPEAQAEAARFFWEPVTLTCGPITTPGVAPTRGNLDFRSGA
ncbi:hypothetical protein [Bradyrhizobium prioriisuperbiae]|uniref:hypothetical protein n=1 Tax=Bradyrhizobium prioriisuperbiae TaxID=2854389 RepID=UPI0028E9C581|nr:hypothetical protein [Bradyrhizobium prioritasuperba]